MFVTTKWGNSEGKVEIFALIVRQRGVSAFLAVEQLPSNVCILLVEPQLFNYDVTVSINPVDLLQLNRELLIRRFPTGPSSRVRRRR